MSDPSFRGSRATAQAAHDRVQTYLERFLTKRDIDRLAYALYGSLNCEQSHTVKITFVIRATELVDHPPTDEQRLRLAFTMKCGERVAAFIEYAFERVRWAKCDRVSESWTYDGDVYTVDPGAWIYPCRDSVLDCIHSDTRIESMKTLYLNVKPRDMTVPRLAVFACGTQANLHLWMFRRAAKRHWSYVRELVCMRRVAFFWYGLHVQRSCALDGAGRQKDRAAFEEEAW